MTNYERERKYKERRKRRIDACMKKNKWSTDDEIIRMAMRVLYDYLQEQGDLEDQDKIKKIHRDVDLDVLARSIDKVVEDCII